MGTWRHGSSVDEIRIFDLTFDEEFKRRFHLGVEQIFEEGYLSNHTFCREFEKKFGSFLDMDDSLFVSSGTSALEIAFRSLGLKGSKVLIPVNTFIATSIACENAGATPVFGDIDTHFFTLSLETIKKHLESDPEIKCIVLVHVGGHISSEIEEIVKYCQEKSVYLVEDCAHAHLSSYNEKRAGTFGDFGCFSHHMTKVMTTGEGGSLVSSSESLMKIAESVRSFGKDLSHSISHVRSGSNFKSSEFQGLMGVLELERISNRVAKRREIALRYQENLDGSKWNAIKEEENSKGSYYKQIVLSDTPAAEVRESLYQNKIMQTGSIYEIPLHRQPIYSGSKNVFPNADHFAKYHFCPPCYPELRLEDVDRICEVLLGS